MAQQYVIRVKQCPGKNLVLAVLGNTLVQATYVQGDKTQLWTLELNQWKNGDNLIAAYSIINAGNGLAAKWNGGGQPIIVATNVLNDQTFCWRLDSVGGGYYAINRWDGGEVMDVKGDNCDPGTVILAYGWNGGDNQRWRIDAA
jgi:hypothetical protein